MEFRNTAELRLSLRKLGASPEIVANQDLIPSLHANDEREIAIN